MGYVIGLLVLASIASAGVGFLMLTQATQGVGFIALGCWFGIMARLWQAGIHHQER